MLKVRNVEIRNPYGNGFECKVTMQFGAGVYDKAEIELSPADVRDIISLAIARATAKIAVDASDVIIAGEVPLLPAEPEFAEVDELAPPAFLADKPVDALDDANEVAF